MIIIKNKIAIERMSFAGTRLATIMEEIADDVVPGVTTLHINNIIEEKMKKAELVPECKGYGGYRHATCISLNDVLVHGVPSSTIVIQEGDLVKIDVVGSYKGYCADMARSFFVGEVSTVVRAITLAAQQALDTAIAHIVPGRHLSDVSACIQNVIEKAGFRVVRDFVGHGIGKRMHEAPEVPNFGTPGNGPILREGMTLAIEPMLTQGNPAITILADRWTAKTKDGGIAGHVEDTVLVSQHGAHVLTRLHSGSHRF